MKSITRLFILLLTLMLLSACATTQNHHDPIEPVNRVTDKVNDGLDRITLKPLAKGYTAAVPKPMRTAVSNFYDNAAYLNTVLNDFLQGKGQQGFLDLSRFLVNSTLGFGGLVDVASSMGLQRHQEDFGQTLATWGFSQGAYIIYPLLGPNSVRNTPDFITSTATSPLFWAGLVLAPYVTIPITAMSYVDTRAKLLDASDMRDELALDPYVFTREAWAQNREYMIYDGHPPVKQDSSDDGWEEDDFDSSDNSTEEPQPTTKISMERVAPADVPASPPSAQTLPASAKALDPMPTDTHASADPLMPSHHYVIYLSSHSTEVEAAAEQAYLAKLGIQTDIQPTTVNKRRSYRLRSGNYTDKATANAQLKALQTRSGLTGAWVEPIKPKL